MVYVVHDRITYHTCQIVANVGTILLTFFHRVLVTIISSCVLARICTIIWLYALYFTEGKKLRHNFKILWLWQSRNNFERLFFSWFLSRNTHHAAFENLIIYLPEAQLGGEKDACRNMVNNGCWNHFDKSRPINGFQKYYSCWYTIFHD